MPEPVRLRVPLTPPQLPEVTSAVLWRPRHDRGRVGVVLAHGAGGNLGDAVLTRVGGGLADRGFPVLAFNFGYAEMGQRRPDPAARLDRAFRDVLETARAEMGERPLVLGGRSMGGRRASCLAAQGEPCAGLLFLGYPLHPAVRAAERAADLPAGRLRTAHWPDLRVPILFVQGERDRLCDLALLDRERHTRLPRAPSTVRVVAGADHGFAVRKRDRRDRAALLDEVVAVAASWLGTLDAAVRAGTR